ncbi:helix-turn-helix domain-containing protein [Paractinoplanes ferrugineus]|uniref:AraC family transcriptional regulator n=1 Tax=Paractinoplanes ferrugineus TaxID=113564 RepID=A0A919MEP2_9ACTN|nr:helix-turn-helix domain-containing protein [Actinoplanes ferrugineus]GIE12978.1 AraC family transcriptional regulator [Actinoplanes ferrugineus]
MRNVVVLMSDTVRPFELAVYCEVFGTDRTDAGVPAFEFAIASARPGVPVPTFGGLTVTPAAGLARLAEADVIALAPPAEPVRTVDAAVTAALRAASTRGARLVAAWSAAFTLASAGLLDDRTVVVPPVLADQLTDWFPRVRADPSARYVDDDPIFTGAAIDVCLHLIRREHGRAAADAVAQGMLAGPPRPLSPPRRPDDDIAALLDWAAVNLHEDLSVEVMARRALLSTRSLGRRFRAATGTTPYAWVLEQRVSLARQLLESQPDLGVEEAAGRVGFSSAALLRQHFQRRFGCSPTKYRERFAP